MHDTLQLDALFIALAVLMFVLFAIAVLVIVDHKAKIPSGEKHDAFSISGVRGDHPVWAWMVSMLLWVIIGVLAVSSAYSIGKHFFALGEEEPKEGADLFATLDREHLAERVRHFHNSPTEAVYSKGVQPICYSCHGEFPHSAKPMVRTLLNMHTQFVGCMTCHADAQKVPEEQLSLRWLNYSGIEVSGKPFGTDVNPETGALAATDDYFSKIVPFRVIPGGEEHLLEITEQSEEAKEFLAIRGQLTTQQQGAVKKMFHNIVNPVGRFCTRCHAPEDESYIPFRRLGFSDKRVTALTNLNIVGIVQKYKEFYIPTIFHGGTSEETRSVLVGEDVALPEPTEEMKNDPRSWWRKAYGDGATEAAQ